MVCTVNMSRTHTIGSSRSDGADAVEKKNKKKNGIKNIYRHSWFGKRPSGGPMSCHFRPPAAMNSVTAIRALARARVHVPQALHKACCPPLTKEREAPV